MILCSAVTNILFKHSLSHHCIFWIFISKTALFCFCFWKFLSSSFPNLPVFVFSHIIFVLYIIFLSASHWMRYNAYFKSHFRFFYHMHDSSIYCKCSFSGHWIASYVISPCSLSLTEVIFCRSSKCVSVIKMSSCGNFFCHLCRGLTMFTDSLVSQFRTSIRL